MPIPTFYNSLTKRLEPFSPSEPGKVRLYHCGPTVYKRQHLGNMRRVLFADFLRRSLEFLGYEVREIMNITDVGHLTQDDIDSGDDKLNKAALAKKTTPEDIAARETEQFFADIQAINVQPAHKYPRATAHIKEMQALIAQLLNNQHAYQTPTGIYFDVTSFTDYGHLSGNTLQSLEAGKRVAVRQEKKHPADFALWVCDDTALQKWESPWGIGYPGWHIECSAMSAAYLHLPIDIHTGGEDNKFPHHENEIAQSEAATGKTFVNVWMHNAHLNLQGGKLSKSSGQQLTLDDIHDQKINPLAFRLLIFGSHYRTPVEFSWESLYGAVENLNRLYQTMRQLRELLTTADSSAITAPDADIVSSFAATLADDLNTPAALAVVNTYITHINARLSRDNSVLPFAREAYATLQKMDHVLGVFGSFLDELEGQQIPDDISELARKREQARQASDFTLADTLRQQIESGGFTVEDTPNGPRIIPV